MARTLAGGAGGGLSEPPIRIAAALLLDESGRTLLVRKRGTLAFMQAGGKIEAGETAVVALIREVAEELGIILDAETLIPLGTRCAPAANEPGRSIEAVLFVAAIDDVVFPAAEIDSVLWIDAGATCTVPLAPLTDIHVLPIAHALALAAETAGSIDAALLWFTTVPVAGWAGSTPRKLVEDNRTEALVNALDALRAGVYA